MHTFDDARAPVGDSAAAPASGAERLAVAVAVTALALFLLGMGFWALGRTVHTWRLAAASEGWEPTTGRVVVSRVVEERRRHRRGGSRVTHDAHVAYEYEVGGRGYRSDRVRIWGLGLSSRRDAERVTERYPWGAAVTVYYDPADPGSAVLVRGARLFARIAGPAVVALLGGLGIFLLAWVAAPAWREFLAPPRVDQPLSRTAIAQAATAMNQRRTPPPDEGRPQAAPASPAPDSRGRRRWWGEDYGY